MLWRANVDWDATLAFAGVENGVANHLLAFVPNDHVVIG